MKKVVAAESEAKSSMQEASQAAKQCLSDAEAQGRAYQEEKQAAASAAVQQMMLDAEAQAAKNQEEIIHHAENQCAVLRAHAESRLSAAADRIVERIVID
jgi:vacuolar-type H+-ATPase subunit H